jgi:hypothetical protein
MKNYYDKVLFLLGLVLVGLGVFVFVKSGGLSDHAASAGIKGALTGKPYETVPAPTFDTPNAEWGADVDQTPDSEPAAGWIYGVFTPPKTWWDKDAGEWNVMPPVPPQPLPPFGLHWVGVKQVPYRIQFNGITGSDADPTLIFADEESNDTFHARKGDTVNARQMKVIDIVVDRTPSPTGMVDTKETATILDMKTKETVTLTKGVPVYLPDHDFLLLQTEDPYPQQDWQITEDKQTQALTVDSQDGEVKFTASDLKLSLDNPSVKVTKAFHFNGKSVIRSRTFPEESSSDSATPATPAAAPAK